MASWLIFVVILVVCVAHLSDDIGRGYPAPKVQVTICPFLPAEEDAVVLNAISSGAATRLVRLVVVTIQSIRCLENLNTE